MYQGRNIRGFEQVLLSNLERFGRAVHRNYPRFLQAQQRLCTSFLHYDDDHFHIDGSLLAIQP